jgi:hypothetical protein
MAMEKSEDPNLALGSGRRFIRRGFALRRFALQQRGDEFAHGFAELANRPFRIRTVLGGSRQPLGQRKFSCEVVGLGMSGMGTADKRLLLRSLPMESALLPQLT